MEFDFLPQLRNSLERSRACFVHWLTWIRRSAPSAAISWSVSRTLILSIGTVVLNSGLWVQHLLMGGSHF
jgi:hypothetical protein